ncbi:MAG: hypothetical protein RMJ43_10505 [Chloroherpetonaceae bacterium]|nr:hypothetical protein [Chthonomonadaceae bacterium]MDW8208260.1 hypothetical protein [Chloroherpetonaceae bacterium]
MSFTLIHTNDLHNRLTQAQADRLRLLRVSLDGEALLLDAGDAVGAGNVTFHPAGEPILDRMSQCGYDAMVVGNREFHVSRYGFQCKLSRARFPVLCANLLPRGGVAEFQRGDSDLRDVDPEESERAPSGVPVTPYLFLQTPKGWKIVIIGLTVPMVTERMAARWVSAYLFRDPVHTARQLVPELRARYSPHCVIALTHLGLRRDQLLAEAVPGIDVIIGGHSHDVLERGVYAGDTLICQTGSHGRFYGRVMLDLDGDRVRGRASLERLDPGGQT